MKPKISIIIPVYNAEKYLRECLDSVLAQTFTDFEVLLINDGSTDNSGQICDAYALQDTRIKVFHQENGGVSSARNLGLDNAKGEWITFVDSDDYLGDNYFYFLKLIPEDADFVLLNITRDIKGEVKSLVNFKENTYSKEDFLLKYPLYPNFPGPWGKFFRLDIIKSNEVVFDEKLSFGEDALFNLTYLKFAKVIVTANYSNYYYRDVEGGLSKAVLDYHSELNLFNYIKKKLNEVLPDGKNNDLIMVMHLKSPVSRLLKSIYIDKTHTLYRLKSLMKTNDKVLKELYNGSRGIGIFLKLIITLKLYKVTDWIYKFIFSK